MDETHRSAYAWALRQLARRMRTEHEIREGLARRGVADGTVTGVMRRLRADGYVDDAQFAAQYVRIRSSHRHYGPRKIREELRRKGVPADCAEQALAVHLPPAREEELALAAACKRAATLRSQGKERKAALYRHLVSRGFSTGAVWTALREYADREDVH